jgi:hypothetical protein
MDCEAKTEEDEWLTPEWNAACERKNDLEGWQNGQEPKHELVKRFTDFCTLMGNANQDLVDHAAKFFGAEFIAAWCNRDAAFFTDLARVALIESGKRRLDDKCVELAVINIATKLWTKEKGNPTREEVMKEATRREIKVGNWSKTFKRCHLDFLKGRGRGRPKK